jgi:hypothetical protein
MLQELVMDRMHGKSSARSLKHHQSLRLKSNEARLNLAVDMSSTIATLSLDSIRDQYPRISKAMLFELARQRLRSRTTSQQHVEDIRAILANTRVNKRKIIDLARKEGTIEIFREIIRPVQTQRKGKRAVRLDDDSCERLKTGDKELKRLQYKVAASREDIDRILSG